MSRPTPSAAAAADAQHSTPTDADGGFRPDVTVATVVVDGDRVLMVEEWVRGQCVMNQPAGHLEPDESLQQAALRETLEETGWEVELTAYIGTYQWRAPDGNEFLRFAFAARATRHHPDRPLDSGIQRAVWLTPAEVESHRSMLRSPLVLKVLQDYLAGCRLPLSALQRMEAGCDHR